MLKERKTLYLAILVILGVAASFAWIVRGSEAFQYCFREKEHDQNYNALQERRDIVTTAIVRLTLNAECSLTFFDKDSGAITALATLIIASAVTHTDGSRICSSFLKIT